MKRVDHRLRKAPNSLRIPLYRTCNRELPSVLEAVPLSIEKEKRITYLSGESTRRGGLPKVVGHDAPD